MKMKIAFLFLTATLVFTAGGSFASGESPGKTFTVKVIELPYTYEVPAITVQTLEFTAPAPEQLTLHRVTGYSVSVAAEHAPFLRMADPTPPRGGHKRYR